MPGSILNADINFPHFTGHESTEEKISTIQNYLYMLYEQLRYSMGNLGTENFSEAGLKDLVEIAAKNIDITGVVTFHDLETEGATIINGANITTGNISADRLNLTGAITWNDLDNNTKNTIYAQAYTPPSYIKSTYIDSTEIRSPIISGGELYATNGNSYIKVDNDSIEFYNKQAGSAGFQQDWYIGVLGNAVSFYSSLYAITIGSIEGVRLSGRIKLTQNYAYGSTTPQTGSEGQLFFVI